MQVLIGGGRADVLLRYITLTKFYSEAWQNVTSDGGDDYNVESD